MTEAKCKQCGLPVDESRATAWQDRQAVKAGFCCFSCEESYLTWKQRQLDECDE